MARQKHVELVRNARFQQIWRSRKGGEVESEVDSLRHLCHLYDVVRVDSEDQKSRRRKERHISLEDNAILCNYLPLLREYVPSAAMEIESEMKSYLSSEGFALHLFF
ncbi:hypothetical protein AXF42_Ash008093 [Apostasia shenzhenica]|uniref:Uncharacterized protein n=1 Tax=Apostasia shenzhenica TaxID=1088818 RepID=A0A2I0A8K5_9ASPA|nr:hypothetical protein AXF42_Ash008093 [Apostasia shenzhenica]